jgi:homoaconitase/3-isopropylmalate dehydratase large subunit
LIAAARALAGKRVQIRTTVTPATRAIEAASRTDGTLGALEAAGCVVLPPGCGACAGLHSGVAEVGERIFSTGTRNFPGRMGHRDAQITLGSAYSAAAAALVGAITDPREVLL